MERKISPDDESRMTGAIEKAAMLASCKDNCNINQTLADCLLEKNVDSRFAKTASAAFNRRLTVLKFQKTDDAHRGDTFGLSDADTVFEMMGGTPTGQRKTASETVTVFKMEMVTVEPPMEKTASEPKKPRYIRYEERTKVPIFERHVESIMDKQAALFMRMTGDLKGMEDNIRGRKVEAAWDLVKTAEENPFAYQTLCNVFGERLTNLLGENMPLNMKMEKQASAVDPDTPLSRKIAKLIEDNDLYVAVNDTLCDYKEWLGGFAKAAAETSKELHKKAAIGLSALTGNIVRSGADAGFAGFQALNDVRESVGNSLDTGFSNVNNILQLVPVEDMAPSEILTPDFIARDRMHDRMLAISDVMADPYIAQFPAEQQFAAANRVMDLHPSMESAENRELLKTEVGDLLMRNNRNGKADLATTYATLAYIGKADKSSEQKAVEHVGELAKKEAPAHFDISGLSKGLHMPLSVKDKDLTSKLVSEVTRISKEDEDRQKSEREAEGKREAESAKQNQEAAKVLAERNKEIAAFITGQGRGGLRGTPWHREIGPNGELRYIDPADPTHIIPHHQLAEHFNI